VFFSTALTFFLVPATYVVVDRARAWLTARLAAPAPLPGRGRS
jgi:hypothetical protein